MVTQLTKPVRRRTDETRRDRSKQRRYIITIYPGGLIGFRLEKCRHEELLPIAVGYETAIRLRIAKKKAEKSKGKSFLAKRGKI